MTRWLPWFIGGMLLAPLSVLAQEIAGAVLRGNDVSLRAEPDADAELVAVLQRRDAIRITGDAETASGETKTVTAETLGTSRSWFFPVEVVETGDAGWVAELLISPRGLTIASPVASSLVPIATQVPTATPAPTVTQLPTQAPTVVPTPTATLISTPTPAPVATQPPVEESPQPGFTPDEVAYFDDMRPILLDVEASLGRYSDLTGSPRVGDSSWEVLLQYEVDVWNESHALALAITAPDSLSSFTTRACYRFLT